MIDQLSSLFSSQCSCRLVSRICRVSCSSHSSTIMRIRIQLRGCRLKQPGLHFSSHWLSIHDAFQKRWFTLNHLYIIPLLSSSSSNSCYRPACISPFILMYTCQKTINCAHELRSIGVATINACVCVWIWKDEEMVCLFY